MIVSPWFLTLGFGEQMDALSICCGEDFELGIEMVLGFEEELVWCCLFFIVYFFSFRSMPPSRFEGER